ncbi:sortase [Streptomyces cavernae]|uniref:sortase n=1 Tax=Streptomyces cavernae TaxID=2259034 RepID=UPI000FEB5D00|nr:sortase [Streptomyces cavernae]
MLKARVAVGIGLVVGAVGLQVPTAVAAGDSNIEIHPLNASPGSTVTVSTTACGSDVTYGKGESAVGGSFHLFKGDREGELSGEFKIPEGTEPSTDTVTLKCPPRVKVTDTYRILGSQPSGAVNAGFGSDEGDGAQLALGGALVAGAAAGGLVRMRRRSADAHSTFSARS